MTIIESIICDEFLVCKYDAMMSNEWNQFLVYSRNGTFLHSRKYLEYHKHRFVDSSLLIYYKKKLVALLPASSNEGVLSSHAGLTYGGLLVGRDFHASYSKPVFLAIQEWCKNAGLKKLIYKAVPHIYHRMPAEEDLYALHNLGAKLIRRDLSTTILIENRYQLTKGRKSIIAKACRENIEILHSRDFDEFMRVEAEHLMHKYGISPVHSSNEISMLAKNFPENIELICAYKEGELIGGVIVYITHTVCHTQYIGATTDGKKVGALDACLEFIFKRLPLNIKWFDFGISTTNNGNFLDLNLVKNKESWGGRSIAYDTYEWGFE